jgi:hypothetical protein
MRTAGFIIFFSIFFTIYGSVNFYIFIRGYQALPVKPLLRNTYVILFLVVSLSFIAGRFFEKVSICPFSDACIWIGSIWLAFMLYLFLAVLFFDMLRLANRIVPFYPPYITAHYDTAKLVAAASVFAVTSTLVLAGFINARSPRLTTVDLTVDKKAGNITSLNIALITDIHLGTIISNSRLACIVDLANGIKPDIILLAGDIVDEDLAPVIEKNMGGTLRLLKSRYGTYAVTGNHEYIGGAARAVRYLEDHGITVLRDRSLVIDGSFILAGREDLSMNRFTGVKRKELSRILEGLDAALPVIVMDHQPSRLHEAVSAGVDLQVSGHTHQGQLWPLNRLIDSIWEIGYGYRQIDSTHFYVSCGVGTWGPPVRTGNRPEVVQVRLRFSGK